MTAVVAAQFDAADVPRVSPEALKVAFRCLIENGRGLALLNGLEEGQIRDVEDALWSTFPNEPETRLAAALRFRALLSAFGAKRLKDLILLTGFRSIEAAVEEAAKQRLNARFGFRQQHFVAALSRLTQKPAPILSAQVIDLPLAA